MTPLTKQVSRLTQLRQRDRGKYRLIVASLLPGDVLGFRMQGTRKVYTIGIDYVLHVAMKLEGERIRRERAQRRKDRRAA
jgi:hypothetical protein